MSPVAPDRDRSGFAAALLLSLALLLAPALGFPGEEMLQDTLKSAVVAFAGLLAALALFDAHRQAPALRWHHALWLPLALAAHALGSMAWSHAYLAGVEVVRWTLFALVAWVALNTLSRERLPLLAACVHGGAVIASGWAAWQFWGGLALFPQGPQPASTFVNRNFFAEFAACALPFGALLLARARSAGAIAALACSVGFVVTAILMTGTRSALVAVALLLALVLPLAAWRCRGALTHWTRAHAALALAAFVATVLLLGNLPTRNPAIVDEGHGATALARGLHRTASIAPSDDSLGVRLQMWRATVRAIADHPWAGLGAGAWEHAIPRYQADGAQLETDYYAHNEILQLVAEYGIVGWLFLVSLAGWLLYAGWRTVVEGGVQADAERPGRFLLLASLLALVAVSQFGFPWRLAGTGALFAACFGALAASDARLARSPLVRPLRWTPALAQAGVVTACAGLVLAGYATWQAVRAESALAGAVRLALAISASGDPADPRHDAAKAQLLQQVRTGIAINPHYRKLTPLVADELARWGDWRDATWIWESVLASRPNVVVLLTNTARGYEMLGRRAEALATLERARRLQPRAPAVRSLEVLMLARAGQEVLALRKARQALAEGVSDDDLVRTAAVLEQRARARQTSASSR